MRWLPWSLAADESEPAAAARVKDAGAASSSDFMRLVSGCSLASWSPFCRLVGREAEAEAWAAKRWRGFATAEGKREKTETKRQVMSD